MAIAANHHDLDRAATCRRCNGDPGGSDVSLLTHVFFATRTPYTARAAAFAGLFMVGICATVSMRCLSRLAKPAIGVVDGAGLRTQRLYEASNGATSVQASALETTAFATALLNPLTPVTVVSPTPAVPWVAPAPAKPAADLGLAPKEHLHDGNPCSDDEEVHAGLCYEKCSALTGGQYVYRQSAWTCCNKPSCNAMSLLTGACCKHNLGFCSGFDVAGLREKGGCPHKPGACLTDEELFLGICYMKCSLLTKGKYPYRVASASCCKDRHIDCLIEDRLTAFHGKSITNSSFAVGGKRGQHTRTTMCRPHVPAQRLTEH